jgi:perosamine synthetase
VSGLARKPYRIPVSRPAYFGNEREYVADAVARRELSMGDYVEMFEWRCAEYLQVKHAIAVSSGTVGLHLAGLVAGWHDVVGALHASRVATSPLTYVASANAIRYCGALPVFSDVSQGTWTASLPDARLFSDVLQVDLYGVPTDTILSGLGRTPVYDACEAFGAEVHRGLPLTHRGGLHVFSFYGNKILTTGEGGLVTTNDDAHAATLRSLRGQGQSPTRRYYHDVIGYNARMTNLQGALGLAQIECVEEHLLRRRVRLAQYFTRLQVGYSSGIEVQVERAGVVRAPWVFAATLPPHVSRDGLMAALDAVGIESRPVFPCLHREGVHATRQRLPVAEDISTHGIVLPLYAEMTEGECDEVCDVVLQELRR